MNKVAAFIKHISEKPWSSFSEADYTLEQWHNACLIHQHDGPPTSKAQCKLPVKTPDGALNRNGVHAAAAALAGARTPIQASAEEKAKAAKALIRDYQLLNERPPPSLMMHSSMDEVLEHHGVKGQKWGIRHKPTGGSVTRHRTSSDAKRIRALRKKKAHELTNQQLKDINARLNMEQNFRRLNPGKFAAGKAFAEAALATATIGVTAYNLVNSPAGKAAVASGKKFLKTK